MSLSVYRRRFDLDPAVSELHRPYAYRLTSQPSGGAGRIANRIHRRNTVASWLPGNHGAVPTHWLDHTNCCHPQWLLRLGCSGHQGSGIVELVELHDLAVAECPEISLWCIYITAGPAVPPCGRA